MAYPTGVSTLELHGLIWQQIYDGLWLFVYLLEFDILSMLRL